MPLTTALFTGLSGLSVNQVALDVIGNNIANVNTTAFKSSRAMFDPQFSESSSFGSPPGEVFGGSNPSQKGLGAVVKSIQRNFDPGNVQPTGVNTDMAIQGEGLFIIEGNERLYTRNGSFGLNAEHCLTTTDGQYVMGFGVDPNFNVVQGQLQHLEIPLGLMTTARATSNVTLGGSLRSNGDLATAATALQTQTFTNSAGGAVTATTRLVDLRDGGDQAFFTGTTITFQGVRGGRVQPVRTLDVTGATTVQDLMDLMVGGYGINTDPSLPAPGGAQVVAAGGGYAIEITGNVGTENDIEFGSGTLQTTSLTVPGPLTLTRTAEAVGESVYTSMQVYDSLGNALDLNVTMTLESSDNSGKTWRFYVNSNDTTDPSSALGSGTVKFDTVGSFVSTTGNTVAIARNDTGAITPLNVTLDFRQVQGLTVLSSQLNSILQDGTQAGTLNDFSITTDGKIVGTFTNGMTQTLGQVALATFSNYEGLIDFGQNCYKAGPNSGVAVIGAPQASGAGSVIGNALETSNVDISREFINMIVASTGFSASSRVITTSNQLLTELMGIVR